MVKLTPGQSVKTEREGQWRQTRVLQVDASLVRVSEGVKYNPARDIRVGVRSYIILKT